MDGNEIIGSQTIMIIIKNNTSMQLEAVQSIISYFAEDQETYINCLTESVKIKENASKYLLYFLETQLLPLMNHGLSVVSVASIAEVVSEEITSQCSMMELYAHHLAMATRNDDIEEAYSTISKRIYDNVYEMLSDIRQKVQQAINDPETMEYAEGADMVANLKKGL